MNNTNNSVTFWVWFADRWQGILLQPGQEVTLDERHGTDEGWASTAEVYRLTEDGAVVECAVYTDGRDCDGRMSTEWHGFCRVEDLAATPADDHGPARPKWTTTKRGQRDYQAEAAGY